MSPTVASLLCLGLCLAQKIPSAEGELFQPSIRAVPGSVVSLGAGVSLYCQGLQGNNSFQLWKDENFVLQINTSRREAEFPLRVEGTDAIGHYRCRYRQGPHWSEFSAPLQLLVTGFFSKPSFLARPGALVAAGETVTLTCQISVPSGIPKSTFFLLKAGVPDPLQSQSTKGHVANFTLPSVKAEDAGNYSCIYSEEEGRRRASDPSELLRLDVTDEKDTHPQREDEKNTHPQRKDLSSVGASSLGVGCHYYSHFIAGKTGANRTLHHGQYRLPQPGGPGPPHPGGGAGRGLVQPQGLLRSRPAPPKMGATEQGSRAPGKAWGSQPLREGSRGPGRRETRPAPFPSSSSDPCYALLAPLNVLFGVLPAQALAPQALPVSENLTQHLLVNKGITPPAGLPGNCRKFQSLCLHSLVPLGWGI